MQSELTKKLVAVAFGIIISIILIEVFFYIAPNFLPRNVRFVSTSIFDNDLRQYFKPNIHTIQTLDDGIMWKLDTTNLKMNGIGFRDDGVNSEVYAIVVGDSHVYGHGVDLEKVWTELLEKKVGAEIVNMGQPAAFPETQVKILEIYGIKMKPKIIFFAIFQNDWADAASFVREKEDTYTFMKRFLDSYSSTYRLVRFVVNLKKYQGSSNYPSYSDGNVSMKFYPFHLGAVINDTNPDINFGKESMKQSMLKAAEIAKSNNAEIIFFVFPSREQIYWEFAKEYAPDKEFDIDKLNKEVSKICREKNFRCIDLENAFRKNMGKQIFFEIDGHPNNEAQKIISEEVYGYISENNLLPR